MDSFLGIKSTKSASDAGAAVASHATRPWVEKYRPKSVDDVAMQDEVVAVLKKAIEGHDVSYAMFICHVSLCYFCRETHQCVPVL